MTGGQGTSVIEKQRGGESEDGNRERGVTRTGGQGKSLVRRLSGGGTAGFGEDEGDDKVASFWRWWREQHVEHDGANSKVKSMRTEELQ